MSVSSSSLTDFSFNLYELQIFIRSLKRIDHELSSIGEDRLLHVMIAQIGFTNRLKDNAIFFVKSIALRDLHVFHCEAFLLR